MLSNTHTLHFQVFISWVFMEHRKGIAKQLQISIHMNVGSHISVNSCCVPFSLTYLLNFLHFTQVILNVDFAFFPPNIPAKNAWWEGTKLDPTPGRGKLNCSSTEHSTTVAAL